MAPSLSAALRALSCGRWGKDSSTSLERASASCRSPNKTSSASASRTNGARPRSGGAPRQAGPEPAGDECRLYRRSLVATARNNGRLARRGASCLSPHLASLPDGPAMPAKSAG
jgi:hypothetical protein